MNNVYPICGENENTVEHMQRESGGAYGSLSSQLLPQIAASYIYTVLWCEWMKNSKCNTVMAVQ